MKILKLMIPVVLATAMLVGCAASNAPDPKPSTEDQQEVEEKETEEKDTETIADGFLPTKPAPIMIVSTYNDSVNSNGLYVNYYKASVLSNGYEELRKTLDEINAEIEAMAKKFVEENSSPDTANEDEYVADFDVEICRADEKVVSILVRESSYLGGAHPNVVTYGYNIDTQTGKLLSNEEIISNKEAFVAAVEEVIKSSKEYEETSESYFTTVPEAMASEDSYNIYLDGDGVTVQFDADIVAEYAVGPVLASLKAKDYDFINRDYFVEYVNTARELVWGLFYNEDFNKDGLEETLSLNIEFADYVNTFYDKYIITYNGEEYISTNDSSWFGTVYVTSIDGNTVVLLQTTAENDYGIVSVIAFTKNGVVETIYGNANLPKGGKIDIDYFAMSSKVDVLGSYSGYRQYIINDKYEITPAEDRFRIQHYDTDYSKLTTKVEIEGYLVDLPSQSVADDMVTIPAGTDVLVYVTDEKSFVWLMLEDGRVVEYNIDRSGWPMLINGMNEEDVFEFLPYAG